MKGHLRYGAARSCRCKGGERVTIGTSSCSGSLSVARYRKFPVVASHGTCIGVKTLNQLPLGCIQLVLFARCPPPALLLSRTPVLDG